ncbi:hypothetical protein PoB_000756200 [Plakobranchus ocellatus]|uniref:Uncharacterized protein n=1 Tax=Plakobranchus ocellatus TaxID=259542 RepID=A0AAV3YF27_9GAST|nr:hypothetical protein PoB_000756200 [Plakobranchus ocellatus]
MGVPPRRRMCVEVSQHKKGLRKPPKELSQGKFRNSGIGRQGDTLIRAGRSSAFLLLATEAAPRAASVQGFFATPGSGEGSGVFFDLVMGYVLRFSSRAPRPP